MTEGRPGTPLLLGCRVVDASTCRPAGPSTYTSRSTSAENVVHAGQLFFPAAVTEAVHATAPYSAHGTSPDTPNPQDAVYRNGGRYGMLALKKTARGYTGTITMGVHV
jgi:hypothetical protein